MLKNNVYSSDRGVVWLAGISAYVLTQWAIVYVHVDTDVSMSSGSVQMHKSLLSSLSACRACFVHSNGLGTSDRFALLQFATITCMCVCVLRRMRPLQPHPTSFSQIICAMKCQREELLGKVF